MTETKLHIIKPHSRGDVKKVTTIKNEKVERQEQLFVEDWGVFIKCAPYDNHFVFMSSLPNQSTYMCTCGSPAVVVPPGPTGMFVCLHHATYGNHTTGEKRWV